MKSRIELQNEIIEELLNQIKYLRKELEATKKLPVKDTIDALKKTGLGDVYVIPPPVIPEEMKLDGFKFNGPASSNVKIDALTIKKCKELIGQMLLAADEIKHSPNFATVGDMVNHKTIFIHECYQKIVKLADISEIKIAADAFRCYLIEYINSGRNHEIALKVAKKKQALEELLYKYFNLEFGIGDSNGTPTT